VNELKSVGPERYLEQPLNLRRRTRFRVIGGLHWRTHRGQGKKNLPPLWGIDPAAWNRRGLLPRVHFRSFELYNAGLRDAVTAG